MKFGINDRYKTAADFDQRASQFEFPVEVWAVAAEVADSEGSISSTELEENTGLSLVQVRDSLDQLRAEGLIEAILVSWKDFSEARAKVLAEAGVTTSIGKAGLSPKTGGGAGPTAAQINRTVIEQVAMRLGTISAPKVSKDMERAWIGKKPSAAQPAKAAAVAPSKPGAAPVSKAPKIGKGNGFLLRPLLEKIESLKGGGVEGQLLVYQVFLHVPFQLLHDEGIRSLHLVDDQTLIENPELYDAIAKATKEVTGMDLLS